MKMNRRTALTGVAALSALAVSPFSLSTATRAQSVSENELANPGPLPDMIKGDENAPITVIEYASLSCPACKAFHDGAYSVLMTDYVEKGHARLIYRDFPLNPPAYATAMLARCAPEEQFFDVIGLFFETQRQWATSQNVVGELLTIARQIGFTQEEFETCLTNQSLLDDLNAVKNRASEEFGVSSTPTFFINGETIRGAMTEETLREEMSSRL